MYTSRTLHSGRHMTYRESYSSEGKRPKRLNPPTKRWKPEDLIRAFDHYLQTDPSASTLKSFMLEDAADALSARKSDLQQAIHILRISGRYRFRVDNGLPHDIHRYPSAYAKYAIKKGKNPGFFEKRSGYSGWRAMIYRFEFRDGPQHSG